MRKNTDNDFEYLRNGELTRPFLDTEDLRDSVDEIFDYGRFSKNNESSYISSLIKFIHSQIIFSDDEKFKDKEFNRTSEDIYLDRVALDSNDYALLYATFARQLRIPTTCLYAVDQRDFINLTKGNGSDIKNDKLLTRVFCECYYDEHWVLVDPTFDYIIKDYNPFEIQIPCGDKTKKFVAYKRCHDLGKKMTLSEMKQFEKENCKKIGEKINHYYNLKEQDADYNA